MSKFAKLAIAVFFVAVLAPPVIAQAKTGLVVLDVRKLPCSNIEAAKDVMGDDENAVQVLVFTIAASRIHRDASGQNVESLAV